MPLEHVTTLNNQPFYLIEFASNMCGSCKVFEPTFKKLAAKLQKEGMPVGSINIDEKAAMQVAGAEESNDPDMDSMMEEGIPNLRLYYMDNGERKHLSLLRGGDITNDKFPSLKKMEKQIKLHPGVVGYLKKEDL